MSWKNVRLIFMREVRDQLRDRRTLFMITVLPLLLYPMLGLGVVQMMLTFSEQQRVVVILNADDLPEAPALLDGDGIHADWHKNGQDESSRLRILAERESEVNPDEHADALPHALGNESGTSEDRPLRHGDKTDTELLAAAHGLAAQIATLQSLIVPPTAIEDDVTDEVAIGQKCAALKDLVNERFGESGFQVLVVVPQGYGDAMKSMQDRIKARSQGAETGGMQIVSVPPLIVVRNSADDKSSVAFARVQKALANWEDAVRRHSFELAALPVELEHPARLTYIEVAGEAQVALTWTPRGATRTSSTPAPSRSIAACTFALAPLSTRKNTHPPPPAPHTLAALAPARAVAFTRRSINGVVIPGAFFFRWLHSARISAPNSSQSDFASAPRTPFAIAEISSNARYTRRSPSTCFFITSQLLIPEFRGSPVYASTIRSSNSARSTSSPIRLMPAGPISIALTPPYMAG